MEHKQTQTTEFAMRLDNLLKEKGITRNADFAKAIGKPQTVTLGWKKGKVPRLQEDWRSLCEFFDTTADHLLLGRSRHEPARITIEIPMTDPNWMDTSRLDPSDEHDQAILGLLMALSIIMHKKVLTKHKS